MVGYWLIVMVCILTNTQPWFGWMVMGKAGLFLFGRGKLASTRTLRVDFILLDKSCFPWEKWTGCLYQDKIWLDWALIHIRLTWLSHPKKKKKTTKKTKRLPLSNESRNEFYFSAQDIILILPLTTTKIHALHSDVEEQSIFVGHFSSVRSFNSLCGLRNDSKDDSKFHILGCIAAVVYNL